MNLPVEYKVENFEKATITKIKNNPVSVFSSGKFNMLSEYV